MKTIKKAISFISLLVLSVSALSQTNTVVIPANEIGVDQEERVACQNNNGIQYYEQPSNNQGYKLVGFQSEQIGGPGSCIVSNSYIIKARFDHPNFSNDEITSITLRFDLMRSTGANNNADLDVLLPQHSCASSTDLQEIYDCSSITNGVPYVPIEQDIPAASNWQTHTIIIDANTSPNLLALDQSADFFHVSFYDNDQVMLVRNIECEVTYDCDLPLAPTNLIATAISSSEIDLSWNSVAEATSYEIFKNGVLEETTSQNLITIDNLQEGTAYTFTVTAKNHCGSSSPSGSASATTEYETIVDFSVSDLFAVPGQAISLTNLSSQVFDSFSWDLSGGLPGSSTLENVPQVIYNTEGVYTITLTANSSLLGISISESKTIYINDQYSCVGDVLIEGGVNEIFDCFNGEQIALAAQANSVAANAGANLTYTWKLYQMDCSSNNVSLSAYQTYTNVNNGNVSIDLPLSDDNCIYVELEISTAYCDLPIASDYIYIRPSSQTFTGPNTLSLTGIHYSGFDNSGTPYFANFITGEETFKVQSGANVEIYFGTSTILTPGSGVKNGAELIIRPAECYVITKAAQQAPNSITENLESSDSENEQYEISVYPNPTTGVFTVEFDQVFSDNATIEIYNSLGELLFKERTVRKRNQMNLSSYPKGVYILRVNNGAGYPQPIRLVRQ